MPESLHNKADVQYRSLVSEIVAQVWGVLPLDARFSEHGVDSMSAVRIQRECQKRTGIRLPLTSFLGEASIQSVATLLAEHRLEPNSSEDLQTPEHHSVSSDRGALTPVQATYWVGRGFDYPLGGISPRFYAEYELDYSQSDIPRLTRAWQEVIQHHGMLRATVDRHGIQHIADYGECGEHHIPVHRGHREATRRTLTHRVPDLEHWPVHDIEITILNSEKLCVHVGFEVILLDFLGIRRVLNDWGDVLAGHHLTPITQELIDIPPCQPTASDLDYWRHRELPPSPFLDLLTSQGASDSAALATLQTGGYFRRHAARISAQAWSQFQDCVAQYGASPSGALLAVAAHALHVSGVASRFSLATTFFSPGSVDGGDDTESRVGDYTRTGVVEVDNTGTFAERARAASRELWETLDHGTVTSAQIAALHHHNPGISLWCLPRLWGTQMPRTGLES